MKLLPTETKKNMAANKGRTCGGKEKQQRLQPRKNTLARETSERGF